ncbi:TetR family transcriptional regulator [Scytonema sp. UIC 10036]|uniref:TetR/AcrR family transcriptional regulator n=1 Tax=Scytonema sp. UIC 10036 TaxID=2304196 RepID=UPI0012DA1285|nr:TetR/AcrR family transcriptional regulator [Scytonema sp. UIC 10036]MUG92369.1 TetR family transcriptional regulator [Scytonema sp. UIC 10036]
MARPREFDTDKALANAMYAFWQKGYCATSLEDLEAKMGLKRQSIYYAFGDKRTLFLRALKLYREQGLAFVREQLNRFDSPKQAIDETVRLLARGTLIDGKRCGCFIAKSALELADCDSDVAAEVKYMSNRLEEYFIEVIEQGQQCGEVSKLHSSSSLAKFIVNSINGLRILEKTQPSNEEIEHLISVVLSVLAA